MKIKCPSCGLAGNINDATVPVTGLSMNCPKCKAAFVVEKKEDGAVNAGGMTNTCPSCHYSTFSEETFSVCPECGLVVGDYHRMLSEQRAMDEKVKLAQKIRAQDEKSRQKYGLDEPPKAKEEKVEVKVAAPMPVQMVGWGVVAMGVILALYAGKDIFEYLDKMSAADAAIQAGDNAHSAIFLFFNYGLIPILLAPYCLVMLVIAAKFLHLELKSIKALEIGLWTGMGLGAMHELIELFYWFQRASSDASAGYYLTGVVSTLLMATLWIAPQFVLVRYLGSSQFDEVAGFFN